MREMLRALRNNTRGSRATGSTESERKHAESLVSYKTIPKGDDEMERLVKWPTEREMIDTELNFVNVRAEERGIDSTEYTVLRCITVFIIDAMFAFKCAEMNYIRGERALVEEDIAKMKESQAKYMFMTMCLPDRYMRLKQKLARTFTLKNRVAIPRLYGMVSEVESVAVAEKRTILEG